MKSVCKWIVCLLLRRQHDIWFNWNMKTIKTHWSDYDDLQEKGLYVLCRKSFLCHRILIVMFSITMQLQFTHKLNVFMHSLTQMRAWLDVWKNAWKSEVELSRKGSGFSGFWYALVLVRCHARDSWATLLSLNNLNGGKIVHFCLVKLRYSSRRL